MIDEKVLEEGVELQRASQAQQWVLPESMRRSDITVLEASTDIGHSGFADLGFRARPVMRVLYRKTSTSSQYPLALTGYVYFDASGREVVFSRFPRLPGTSAPRSRCPAAARSPSRRPRMGGYVTGTAAARGVTAAGGR
jgi:hypothetical protein